MPTYEYVCTECGEPLEVVQSIHDAALTECPRCQGRLRKVFGNVGVVFKGSGFYRTDSRGKKSAAAPSSTDSKGDSAAKPAASSGSGSSAGSDSGSSTTKGSAAGGSASSAGSSGGSGSTAAASA